MPFKSEAQRAWMYANHPEMAKKWEKHTPKGKKLPKRVNSKESFERAIDKALNETITKGATKGSTYGAIGPQ